jgi:hypothetical protein
MVLPLESEGEKSRAKDLHGNEPHIQDQFRHKSVADEMFPPIGDLAGAWG